MDAEEREAQWESGEKSDSRTWTPEAFLDAMELDLSRTNVEHMAVLCEAMQLYAERNNTYKDLWKVDGWMGLVHHIRHKSLRIHRLFIRHQDGERMPKADDAPDLINYTVMFIRMARGGVDKKYED